MRSVLGMLCNLAIIGSSSAQFAEQWSRHFIVSGAVYTAASAVGLDGAGNIYLAGLSSAEDDSSRLYIAKLDGSGAQHWLREFDPTPDVDDFTSGLAVHLDGTVYLAGTADYGVDTWLHAITPDGNVQRQTNLDLTSISGLKTDSSGNLYLSGFNWSAAGAEGDYDIASYFLRKEAANGELVWAHSIPVGGHSVSYGQGIALDAAENVFTARVVDGRILVCKFDASGRQLWQTRNNGSFVGPNTPMVDADSSGNLLIIADAQTPVLVKFDAAGVQQWSTRIHSPSYASVLLPLEHYVLFGTRSLRATTDGLTRPAGTLNANSGSPLSYSDPVRLLRTGTSDFLFIETQSGYDEAQTNYTGRVSLRRYEITNSLPTEPSVEILTRSQTFRLGESITLAASGSSTGVLSYQWFRDAPTPMLEGETNSTITISNLWQGNVGAYWVRVRDDSGEVSSREVVIDAFVPPVGHRAIQGEAIVFNASAYQTPAQSVQWFHKGAPVPGATNESLALTNATVADAGAYRVVYRGAFGDEFEAEILLEVNDQVREHWRREIGGDYFGAMELDPSSNLIVSSRRYSYDNGYQSAANVFSPDGTRTEHIINGVSLVRGVALDEAGNIYLSGGAQYSSTVQTLKYSPGFESVLWRKTNAYGTYRAYAGSPTKASTDHVFVSVHGQRLSGTGRQFFSLLGVTETNSTSLAGGGGYHTDETIVALEIGKHDDLYLLASRYQPWPGALTLARVRQSGGTFWQFTEFQTNGYFTTMTTDPDGNVILAGTIWQTSISVVAKLGTNGNMLWRRTFADGPSPRAVKSDSAGNIVVTGEGATLKYDPEGRLLWVTRVGGSYLGLDAADNIYMSGGGSHSYPSKPASTVALNPAGTRLWEVIFTGANTDHRNPLALSVSAGGDVYAAFGIGPPFPDGFTIVKYSTATGTNSPSAPTTPASAVGRPGQPLMLTLAPAAVAGEVQWLFNGVPLDGETNASLVIPSYGTNNTGGYSVELRNAFGSVLTAETWVTESLKLNQTGSAISPGWNFAADARYRYEIQGSSDFQHWTTIRAYAGMQGSVHFSPPETNDTQRFFRVQMLR